MYRESEFLNILKSEDDKDLWKLEERPESGIKLLAKLKRWELMVLNEADLIISPSACQLRYMCDNQWNNKFFPLAHSFDSAFYKKQENVSSKEKVKLRYIGYSDAMRSLKPIVYAIKEMKEERSPALNNLEIEFIGNIPCIIKDMVMNYYLYDYIKCLPSVDYYESLRLMQEADWLIHVDAYFSEIKPGGSIFFAGKLADYMGANKPIFAMTGNGSPAYDIVSQYGGLCSESSDIEGIKTHLEHIGCGSEIEINQEFRSQFDASKIAGDFDKKIKELVEKKGSVELINWPEMPQNHEEKLLSICVPSYNVGKYLSRCLVSLVDYSMAGYTEVLIIDDGSVDDTAEIGKVFSEKYPGIVCLHKKRNGGHGSTINYAMKIAKGKYFRVVDGDDWVDSAMLDKLLNNVLQSNVDADVISSNYHEIDIETACEREVVQAEEVNFYRLYSFEQLNVKNIYLTLASMMIKTSILKQMKATLQEHAFYVDVEFILYPVPYVQSIMFTPEYIYKYARGNSEQSVAIPNMVKRYEHHTKVLKNVISYEKKVILSDGQKAYYDAIIERLLFTQYALGLVYDEDKVRGYARARKFDKYLYQERNDLYKKIQGEMKILFYARKHRFDYKKTEYVCAKNLTFSSLYRMAQTPIGKRLKSCRGVMKAIEIINKKR